jgi:hypothetical protein
MRNPHICEYRLNFEGYIGVTLIASHLFPSKESTALIKQDTCTIVGLELGSVQHADARCVYLSCLASKRS